MSAYGAFVWNWQLPVPKRPSEPFHTRCFSATKATPCSLMIHYVKYLLASCVTHILLMLKLDKRLHNVGSQVEKLLFCCTLNSTPHPKVASLPVSPADRFWPVEVACLNDAPLHAFLDSFYIVWALLHSSVIHPLYGHFYYQHISSSMYHFSPLLSVFRHYFYHNCLLSISQAEEAVSWLERKKKKSRIVCSLLLINIFNRFPINHCNSRIITLFLY